MEKTEEIKIQYVAHKQLSIDEFVCTSLTSPKSFDDYDINIIDLSDSAIWTNKGVYIDKINAHKDIVTISSMLKNIKNKVLIIFPQNIPYCYEWDWCDNRYKKSEMLKDILSFFNHFISSNFFPNTLIRVAYNNTRTEVLDKYIESDFVFDSLLEKSAVITSSVTSHLPTTIKRNNKYLTTLAFNSNSKLLLNYMRHIGWIMPNEDTPEWLAQEIFFNDMDLERKKQELSIQMQKLQEEIEVYRVEIDKNMFYKGCLCKTGHELGNIIYDMLDKMIGYDYQSFVDNKNEDFLIEKENITFIGEIKGVRHNVKQSNVSQTAKHRDLYKEIEGNEDKNVVALLIIARQRNKPPLERDPVASNVIDAAKRYDVLIVTTEILLKMFELYKLGKLKSEDIISLLGETKGIISEEDILSKIS